MNRNIQILYAACSVSVGSICMANAGYYEGSTAYQAGDYSKALKEWKVKHLSN